MRKINEENETKKERVNAVSSSFSTTSEAYYLVVSALVLLIVVIAVDSFSLRAKNNAYQKQEAELRDQIEEEEQKAEDIEEFEEYVKTDKYVEDKARKNSDLHTRMRFYLKQNKRKLQKIDCVNAQSHPFFDIEGRTI